MLYRSTSPPIDDGRKPLVVFEQMHVVVFAVAVVVVVVVCGQCSASDVSLDCPSD